MWCIDINPTQDLVSLLNNPYTLCEGLSILRSEEALYKSRQTLPRNTANNPRDLIERPYTSPVTLTPEEEKQAAKARKLVLEVNASDDDFYTFIRKTSSKAALDAENKYIEEKKKRERKKENRDAMVYLKKLRSLTSAKFNFLELRKEYREYYKKGHLDRALRALQKMRSNKYVASKGLTKRVRFMEHKISFKIDLLSYKRVKELKDIDGMYTSLYWAIINNKAYLRSKPKYKNKLEKILKRLRHERTNIRRTSPHENITSRV